MSADIPPPPPVPPAYGPPPPPPPPPSSTPAQPNTSGAAIASLVLGLLSLFCFCFTAVPGLICGLVALSNISKSNGLLKGKGLALLGILLSLAFPIVTAAVSYAALKRPLNNFITVIGAQSNDGSQVYQALRTYASAHDGALPQTFQQLVDAGLLSPTGLKADPLFWTLEHGGEQLDSLEPNTIIARCGPFSFGSVTLRVVVYANGEVTTDQVEAEGSPRMAP